MKYRYRARVADAGASQMAGNVAFTLDLGLLTDAPIVTGVITHPTQGRTEMRPFRVRALFPDTLIADLVANERWTAIGRLFDVGRQPAADDPDTDPWNTYGTGRVSAMGEPDGRGMVELEVSDESWRARRSSVFAPDPSDLAATQNTTQLWPSGPKRAWRGLPAAHKASGSRLQTQGQLHRIRMVGGGSAKQVGRAVTDKLHRWVQNDAKDEPILGAAPTSGNFRTLRLNYAGTDYEVISFGQAVLTRDAPQEEVYFPYDSDGIVPEDLGRTIQNEDTRTEQVTVHAWILAGSTPPASGDAYLHAPSAPPSEDMPLHIGLDWDGHRWGTDGGWIHLADLTRRYFDAAGMAYDSDTLDSSEADLSIPALAPVVREEPADEWAWFEDETWAPSSHMVLRAGGGLKLVDMRLPQDVDPDTLTVLDASNTNAYSWILIGREVVTSVTYHYLATTHGDQESGALDGLVYKEVEGDPVLADAQAIQASGKRNVDYKMGAVLEPTANSLRQTTVKLSGRGAVFGQVADAMANDVLDIYRDGAWRMSLEIDGSEDVSEGQACILDMGSIKAANPDTQSRTGFRLVRILSLETHPDHYKADLIDLGPKLAPLAAATITLAQNSDRHVVVTLSGTPAGTEAVVEVAYTDSSASPESWGERRSNLGDGAHVFRDPPRVGYAHARVKTRAPNRIRSPWVSPFPIPLLKDPQVTGLFVVIDDTGSPVVLGTPNAAAQGVRLRYVIHDAGTTPVFPAVIEL